MAYPDEVAILSRFFGRSIKGGTIVATHENGSIDSLSLPYWIRTVKQFLLK
jgi:hypothetical protein